MNEECQVEISRAVGWTDKYCSYIVYVNGKEMERLKQGECKSFSISPGSHEMVLKVAWSWHRSNKIKFNAIGGQEIVFSCRSNTNVWRKLFGILYIVFGFNNCVVLEKTS